jgi:hypothetical protein
LDGLRAQVRDAVRCHFDEGAVPPIIRLHFSHDEIIAARRCRAICRAATSHCGSSSSATT